jgi:hypothetical protein
MANNFKNAFATSISTSSGSPTDVYTANNGLAVNSICVELDCCNTGASSVDVSVKIYDSSATTGYFLTKETPVPAGGTLKVVSGQKIVLNGDDKIQVYASAATVDVVASILEDVT